MSFPQYPEYKDSRIGFLGKIPIHWALKRLKHCAEVFPSNVDKKSVEGQVPVKLCNYTDVYYNDIIDAELNFMSATATKAQIRRFELQQGDVVFTKDSESANDIGVAALVPHSLPGVIYGYHLSIARAQDFVSGNFLKRYFDSKGTKAYFETSANGLTRVGLGQYAVDNAPIALPSLGEQTQIARFLDHETAKIDALIREQERLIGLLQEKRQAVISHAVTKGLDPDVSMKDSGVEWLGEVPAHWDVTSLKMLVDVKDGTHETPNYVEQSDNSFPLVTSRDVTGGKLHVEECNHISADDFHSIIRRSGVAKGDILMPMIGTVGSPLFLDDDFQIAIKNLALFKTSSRSAGIAPMFLLHFLTSNECRVQFDLESRGGVQSFVSLGTLRNLSVPVVPVDEQERIVEYIEVQVGQIDDLANSAARGISLLKERRSALISAAVIGKIDVRDWQPPADESAFDEEVRQAGLEATA